MSSSPLLVGADQPLVSARPQSPYLRIHAINVYVSDQDRSLGFYLNQLGFTLVGDVRFGSGERWVAVMPPDGSATLSLVAPKPDSKAVELIGRPTHVVFVTEDVVAVFNEWRKRGVRFQYTPRLKRVKYDRQGIPPAANDGSNLPTDSGSVWGGVMTHFKDPDGNTFALVSYDEESRAVEAHRREIAARQEQERRIAQELEIAKQVQTGLFPQTLPALSTLDYAGICIQARQVGGDYYDFLDLGRERLGLVLADISGKGIAAALLMANLQANLRSQCAVAADQPQRFLQLMNRLFFANSPENAYATLFFGEYDNRERRLRYANCGHLSALLLRENQTLERLDATGTVLGLFEDWDCLTWDLELSTGDTLALYTDGITEAFNDLGEEFGEQRLVESLQRHCGKNSKVLVTAVVDDVKKFSPHEQTDDITLIVARCR